MNRKASVEWRLIWLIIVIVTAVAAITLIILLFYAGSHGPSALSSFSNILGGL